MAARNQHAIQPLPHFYRMPPKKVHDEFQFRIGLPERIPTWKQCSDDDDERTQQNTETMR